MYKFRTIKDDAGTNKKVVTCGLKLLSSVVFMGFSSQSITILFGTIESLVKWPQGIYTVEKKIIASGLGFWEEDGHRDPPRCRGLNCPIMLLLVFSHQHVVMQLSYYRQPQAAELCLLVAELQFLSHWQYKAVRLACVMPMTDKPSYNKITAPEVVTKITKANVLQD